MFVSMRIDTKISIFDSIITDTKNDECTLWEKVIRSYLLGISGRYLFIFYGLRLMCLVVLFVLVVLVVLNYPALHCTYPKLLFLPLHPLLSRTLLLKLHLLALLTLNLILLTFFTLLTLTLTLTLILTLTLALRTPTPQGLVLFF
jgi:hypothetical protein